MKTVILMRHGKSSWKDRSLDDHDRPLNKRGRKAATTMARWLAAEGIVPDMVLCSSSRRTRETLEIVRAALPGLPEPGVSAELYEAAPAVLLDALRRLREGAPSVLLIGHQPGLGALVDLLARRVFPTEDDRALEKFPTAAVAVLEADIAYWPELGPGTARMVAFVTPREVEADLASPR